MTSFEDASTSIIEALRQLSQPIVFAHPSYAIAALTNTTLDTAKANTEIDKSIEVDRTAMAMAEMLFQHMRRGKAKTLLVTSAVPLPATVTFVLEFIHCLANHIRVPSSTRMTLRRSLCAALDLLLHWARPAAGFRLTATFSTHASRTTSSVAAPIAPLHVFVDVFYSSPLLQRPWTTNVLLAAVAAAPEWRLRALCRSRRVSLWIHRHAMPRLGPCSSAERLGRWRWLESRLEALLSPSGMTVVVRTMCAILLAVESELVAGGGGVSPRCAERDGDGLRLLAALLAQRGGELDRALDEESAGAAAAFLRQHASGVDLSPPSEAVRRLGGVADELYRFLAEWMRRAADAALADPLGAPHASLPSHEASLTLLVSRVACGGGDVSARSSASPLSLLPAHFVGDDVMRQQSHRMRPEAPRTRAALPYWFLDLLTHGAIRCADTCAAQWRTRVAHAMETAVGTAQGAHVFCKTTGHPLLRVQHVAAEVVYNLSWRYFPSLPCGGRRLVEYVDTSVLERMGVHGERRADGAETEYVAQLRSGYEHVWRRALAAVEVAETDASCMGLHLIPSLSQPVTVLHRAVKASLATQLLPILNPGVDGGSLEEPNTHEERCTTRKEAMTEKAMLPHNTSKKAKGRCAEVSSLSMEEWFRLIDDILAPPVRDTVSTTVGATLSC